MLDRRVEGGWLLPSGAPGLPGFTPKFETAMARLLVLLTAIDPSGSPGPCWYPPVVPLADVERADYAKSFPHLLGSVHALATETVTAQGAGSTQVPTDGVLAPAVCYSIYGRLAGSVIDEPAFCDIAGYCYRHEATSELGRFRAFRVRDFVTVAPADAAWQFRDDWITRCEELFTRLGLKFSVQAASDPFFGPGGRFMRSSQIEQNLKYEFVVPLHDADSGTAIASANCHKDYFGQRFAITLPDRTPAHSSCMGFGLERTVLALIHAHGDELTNWPELI